MVSPRFFQADGTPVAGSQHSTLASCWLMDGSGCHFLQRVVAGEQFELAFCEAVVREGVVCVYQAPPETLTMLCVLEGYAVIADRLRPRFVVKGMADLIRLHDNHCRIAFPPDRLTKYVWISLPLTYTEHLAPLAADLQQLLRSPQTSGVVYFSPMPFVADFLSVFDLQRLYPRAGRSASPIEIDQWLTIFLLRLLEERRSSKQAIRRAHLNVSQTPELAAWEFHLLTHLEERLPLSDYGRRFGLREVDMRAYLRKKFNKSFPEFMLSLRLDRSMELIRTTTLSLVVISARVGYSHLSSFSSLFKKRYGVSPLSYRHNYRRSAAI